MQRTHAFIASALAALSLCAATPASAQMWGGSGNGLGRGFPGMGMGAGRMGTFHDAATATRGSLDALHARLALTAQQETLWLAFVAAAVAEAGDMDDAHDNMLDARGNAAERMTARAQIMREQADDAAAVAQAFVAFYNSLTATQRAMVDEFFGHGPNAGPRSGPFG